jgi:hypothetical protein
VNDAPDKAYFVHLKIMKEKNSFSMTPSFPHFWFLLGALGLWVKIPYWEFRIWLFVLAGRWIK